MERASRAISLESLSEFYDHSLKNDYPKLREQRSSSPTWSIRSERSELECRRAINAAGFLMDQRFQSDCRMHAGTPGQRPLGTEKQCCAQGTQQQRVHWSV